MINKRLILVLLFIIHGAAYAQQAYQLDVKKSKILWNTRQTMGGHYGYLLFSSGTLIYSSAGQPDNGVFTMDVNSIRSQDHTEAAGNQRVDKELRTPVFFDADKYPAATMRVTKIARVGQSENYKVNGDLTIKGITNPIAFLATVKRKGEVVTVSGEVKMDRLKWNIGKRPANDAQPKPWELITNLQSDIKNKIMVAEIPITLQMVFTR